VRTAHDALESSRDESRSYRRAIQSAPADRGLLAAGRGDRIAGGLGGFSLVWITDLAGEAIERAARLKNAD